MRDWLLWFLVCLAFLLGAFMQQHGLGHLVYGVAGFFAVCTLIGLIFHAYSE